MESIDHRALKQVAISWLLGQSCRAVAAEVTSAVPRWRVDAAGWRKIGLSCETIIVECKQSRCDFLRDDSSTNELVSERQRLQEKRTRIEESRVKVYEPHLRTAQAGLFYESSQWDFTRSKLSDYRRVLVELRRVDAALHGETKFCLMSRYRLADRLYLMCPQGMIRKREVPDGWGLLECPRTLARRNFRSLQGQSEIVRCTIEAPPLLSRPDRRERLLRNIAISATRSAWGHLMPPPVPTSPSGDAHAFEAQKKNGLLF